MPIYEYACALCGHTFDEIQKITEPPITACPSCKQEGARRLISASAFILKGGGWYSDGYGLGGSGKSGGSSSSGSSNGSSGSPSTSNGGTGTGTSTGSGTSTSGTSGTGTAGGGKKNGTASSAPA